MIKFTEYTAYFESIARDLLEHSENEKHFFRKGLEEFLNGMATTVNYPAMLLDKFDYKIIDNGADDIRDHITAAFIIIDHVSDQEDYNKIDAAMDTAKEIVDKIYNRVRRDIRQPYPQNIIQYAALGSVQVTPVYNYADSAYGFFCTIEIVSHHNTTL